MPKKLLSIALGALLMSGVVSAVEPSDYLAKAMSGDYQAQRNLAYTYGSDKRDFGNACAWYLLILRSDSPKLHFGDVTNAETYCGLLAKSDFDARLKAERQANALFQKIYRR